MVLQPSDYLSVPRPCDSPKARLVCFAHSGGGPSAFSAWPDALEAQQVEVVAISAPGRERRASEVGLTDWRAFVAEVCAALDASGLLDDVPYAFFGHSLGALMAFEAVRRLEATLQPGRPRPLHLFVSGHGAPASKAAPRDIPFWGQLHTLADDALVEATQAFGFVPGEVAGNAELLSAVLPALRADFELYEAYSPAAGAAPVAVGIMAFGGEEDKVAPPELLQGWAGETARFCGARVFPGGHFFLEDCRKELLGCIGERMASALAVLPRSAFASAVPAPGNGTVVEAFEEVGRRCPEAEAIVGESERLTYREAMRRVAMLAREVVVGLEGKEGRVVALLMPHDESYVLGMLAIWKAAAVLIVVEAHFPAALVKEVCEESSTRLALVSAEHASKFGDVQGCSVKVVDRVWTNEVVDEPFPKPGPDDVSILMFTSGTTGKPKTIAGSHRFMHLGNLAKLQSFPYGEEDCREAFNVMFVWEVCRPLMLGLTSFVIPDEAALDPVLFVSALRKHGCSRVLTTPSLLSTIMQSCAGELAQLEAMRTWLMCGEVLPMTTVQDFCRLLPGCRLINDYSAWECGDVSYAVVAPRPAFEPSQAFAASGPLACGQCGVILDPETKQVLPLGVSGELYVGGSGLSEGYHRSPELTASKFLPALNEEMQRLLPGGRWYKTGDRARFVGEPPILEVRGRIDSTVKIRGFKVGIPVVEAAVQETVGVAACAVIPMYESPGIVDSLLCFLQPKDGFSFDEAVQNARREAVQRMPRWMLPAFFKPLPSAVSGGESRKLDRKALAKLYDLKGLQEERAAELGAPEEGLDSEDEGFGVAGILRKVWAKALNLNAAALDPEENFFDLGGHSTLAAKIATELSGDYGLPVTVLDIYTHSSLRALQAALEGKGTEVTSDAPLKPRSVPRAGVDMGGAGKGSSVVGLAGRFPGAWDAEEFWQNLLRGAVAAAFLSKDLLRSKGVPEATVNHKDFVPCAYKIDGADKFDHAFFGIGRHEASIMDPQHRVFIETSWAALECAAIPPRTGLPDSVVGVFAAAGIDGYLVHHLDGMPLRDTMDPQDIFLAEIGSEKDYIATRVSYLFDFTGPAMNVNSACSSALVACAQAAAAIATGQCDAAVAGASSITFPNLGFRYQDGLVNSQDGYVRPFDAAASGTVFGDSVATLVLRSRREAGSLAWGTLKGFAVTNDGGLKAGYAAPSPAGQSLAIMGAQRMMGEDPWSVSYVECHCTGTRVGDGIEVRGLLDAFTQLGGQRRDGEAHVALGSVKGNIAHANCAAGATGLIKTLLMLRDEALVPTANFAKLNPKINLEEAPFFVNGECCAWAQMRPLRAGVSSFGIGGTNAHVIMEEPKRVAAPQPREPSFQLFPLSARSPEALQAAGLRVAKAMEHGAFGDASCFAYSLQEGRTAFPLRKAVVLSPEEGKALPVAAAALQARLPAEEELEEMEESVKRPRVAFVFPGQGSQYAGMAKGLYRQVPIFQEAVDHCCMLLAEPDRLGFDLRPLLFPEEGDGEMARPAVLQPALFTVEYGLAQVFLALGVVPVAAAGHSLGEYVAAVVGGLLPLEAAVEIVAARALATEKLAEEGAMLSVSGWKEQELEEVGAGRRPGLWLAAVNSPLHAVISGEQGAVNALEAELKAEGRRCAKLHVNRAFHSGLIAKAAEQLRGLGLPEEAVVGRKTLPVASNLTGRWLSSTQLRQGGYWAEHMRGTVRWRQNAERICAQWQPSIVLEVGPGNVLTTLTGRCVPKDAQPPAFVEAMRHPKAADVHDVKALLQSVGKLWEVGCAVDWQVLQTEVLGLPAPPQLLRLPSYTFDQTSLWANPERSVYVDAVEDPAPAAYSKLGQAGSQPQAVQPSVLLRYGEKPPVEPAVRAYCLPFAGGSAMVFSPWAEQEDSAFEVVAIELPGRGGRSEESMPQGSEEDEALLTSICQAILADLRGAKYILIGFSMGAGLCADLALRLLQQGAPAPLALYMAGRRPPAVDPSAVGLITMSNEELAEYAFAPPEVAQSPEFVEHVVPLLRGDLELDARCEKRLSTLIASGSGLPAGVGLEVFCGTCDTVSPWKEASGWQRFAREAVNVQFFPGGHEFMKDCQAMLIAAIRRNTMARLLQIKTAELTVLAAQGVSGQPVPAMPVQQLAGQGAKADGGLPLYGVRWAPAEAMGAGGEQPVMAPFVVRLAEEPQAALLAAAASAMRAGQALLAVCASGRAWEADAEVAQSWHFVRLVQGLLEEGCAGRLLLACPAAASGAMVAGASKAVALEASELKIQRLFLPEARLECAEEQAVQLAALAQRHLREVDLWLQDEVVFASRLEPVPQPSSRLPCFPARLANNSLPVFVLTGATGGLGRVVLEWMLQEQGLRPEQLVLLRRAGSAALDGALAACRTVTMEAPEEASLTRAFQGVENIAGVLHLAGVLDDGIVQSMSHERMRKVAAPKCDLLAALTATAKALSWPLRWVLGFSSSSSLLGYPGQVNYCAANAVLDHLAAFGADVKVITVNWGPWGEVGMAKVGTKAHEQALQDGDRPLDNATALACLAAALRMAGQAQPAATQLCACDVEWARSQWAQLPIVELLGEGLGPVAAAAPAAAPTEDARQAVQDFLLRQTKTSGGWRRVQGRSLHQLGLDSLEIVQVRNLFNKSFSVNVPLGLVADSGRKLAELAEELTRHVEAR